MNGFATQQSRVGRWLAATSATCFSVLALHGTGVSLPVPNPSFESPVTPFVSILIGSWQKPPKPPDYSEAGGRLWSQLAGVFKNTAPESADHIDNCDGDQALYMFAVPGVGLFLDGTEAGGAFPVSFVPGDSYTLTVGVIGGGGNMLEGAGLSLGLHYLDDLGGRVPVATNNIVHSVATFPVTTHLVDFQVQVPPVQPADAWAGRRMGVSLLSTTGKELEGGYWDLDNVRLTVTHATPETPVTLAIHPTAEGVRVSWASEANRQYQLQRSGDLNAWSDSGAPLPGTGGELFVDLSTGADAATFLRVASSLRP